MIWLCCHNLDSTKLIWRLNFLPNDGSATKSQNTPKSNQWQTPTPESLRRTTNPFEIWGDHKGELSRVSSAGNICHKFLRNPFGGWFRIPAERSDQFCDALNRFKAGQAKASVLTASILNALSGEGALENPIKSTFLLPTHIKSSNYDVLHVSGACTSLSLGHIHPSIRIVHLFIEHMHTFKN